MDFGRTAADLAPAAQCSVDLTFAFDSGIAKAKNNSIQSVESAEQFELAGQHALNVAARL